MKQILAILGMNLRTILERSGSSIVIIIGIAGSVAVMVSLLAMAEGLSNTISSTGEEDRALIFRDGSNSELSSGIYIPQLPIIESVPGIRNSEDGTMIAADLFTIIDEPEEAFEYLVKHMQRLRLLNCFITLILYICLI